MVAEDTEPLVKKVDVHVNEVANYQSTSQEINPVPRGFFNTPSALAIAIPLCLYAFSGLSASVREIALFDRACETNLGLDGVCKDLDNQILVSNVSQFVSLYGNVVGIVGMACIGVLSDIYGRKPLLIFSSLVALTGSVSTYFVLFHSYGLKVKTFVFVRMVYMSMGMSTGFMGMTNMYISDITSQENKSAVMFFVCGFLYAGNLIGGIVCPTLLRLGKWLDMEPREANKIPFYFDIGALALTLLYCLALPESKKFTKSPEPFKFSWENFRIPKIHIIGSIRKVLAPLWLLGVPESIISAPLKQEISRTRFLVFVLLVVMINSTIIASASLIVVVQYGIYLFKWDSETISILIAVISFASIFSLLVLFPFLNKVLFRKVLKFKFKPHHLDSIDFSNLMFGLGGDFIFNVGIALVRNTKDVAVCLLFAGTDSSIIPTVFSAITKFFPEEVTGQVFMALNIVFNIINIVGPLITLQLYKFGITHNYVELPFVVVSIVTFFVIILVSLDRYLTKADGDSDTSEGGTDVPGVSQNTGVVVEEYVQEQEASHLNHV